MTWYVAITNPNCHRRAELGLAAAGYRAFWPKYKKWVSHARVKTAREYPILGRYVFVEIHGDAFGRVRAVNGIMGFVSVEGRPAAVDEKIVLGFMSRYMKGEWDFVAKEEIPDGARIEIMEGEFAGLVTVVRGIESNRIKFLPPRAREFSYTRTKNVRAA